MQRRRFGSWWLFLPSRARASKSTKPRVHSRGVTSGIPRKRHRIARIAVSAKTLLSGDIMCCQFTYPASHVHPRDFESMSTSCMIMNGACLEDECTPLPFRI
ncbi:hypothetical protein BJX99DRAFT_222445 [Aspergillus californicus]